MNFADTIAYLFLVCSAIVSRAGICISGNFMKMFCLNLSNMVEWFSSRCAVIVNHTYEETSTLNMSAQGMLLQHFRSSKAGGTEVVSSMLNLHVCLHGSLRYVVS